MTSPRRAPPLRRGGCAVEPSPHVPGKDGDASPDQPGLGGFIGQAATNDQLGEDLAHNGGETVVLKVLRGEEHGKDALGEQLAVGELV